MFLRATINLAKLLIEIFLWIVQQGRQGAVMAWCMIFMASFCSLSEIGLSLFVGFFSGKSCLISWLATSTYFPLSLFLFAYTVLSDDFSLLAAFLGLAYSFAGVGRAGKLHISQVLPSQPPLQIWPSSWASWLQEGWEAGCLPAMAHQEPSPSSFIITFKSS